jgi:gibberellin A4 carboxyl methyltransferase
VVDYGASTGANSIASIRAAIAAVRARSSDQQVAAVHNDLPTNDWNQLFATGETRGELAAQAAAGWTTFLTARAADLAPGGRLLVQMVGSDPPNVTARKLLRAMTEVARELVADGKLSADAVDRYLLPVYARSTDEARAPLERRDSSLASAFTIETIRTDPVPNPYLDPRRTVTPPGYGRSYAAFARGFTESSLRHHLFEPGVTAGDDPDKVLDDYFGRLAARFAADPEADAFEDWTLTVVLSRR